LAPPRPTQSATRRACRRGRQRAWEPSRALTRLAARQAFLSSTEAAFRTHPLWRGVSEEELEASGEGLEKYLLTKLHGRTFAVVAEDVEKDRVRAAAEAVRLRSRFGLRP